MHESSEPRERGSCYFIHIVLYVRTQIDGPNIASESPPKVGDAGGVSGAARQAGMTNSRTRTVPSSPLARVFGFGQLAAGLAMGTVAEAVRQSVRGGEVDGIGGDEASRRQGGMVKQYVASDANAERLAETLCRMRGAALKLGQMLSIQVGKFRTYWRALSARLDRPRICRVAEFSQARARM